MAAQRPRTRWVLFALCSLVAAPGTSSAQVDNCTDPSDLTCGGSGGGGLNPPNVSISSAPHNGDFAFASRPMTWSWSTPAYYSLDQARSVTLVYSSAAAHPMGLVQLDAFPDPASPATTYTLRLKRPDGSFVTFTNGQTSMVYQASTVTTRLAAQFDASSLSTGAYDYTASVRFDMTDGSSWEKTVPVRIVVVNEQSGYLGAGWTVGGVKKLHVQSDNSAVLTDGAGGASYFAPVVCGTECVYPSPPGDFSTLKMGLTEHTRTFIDGTVEAYDGSGRLTRIEDRFGNATTFTYLSDGRLRYITDPVGKVTTFVFDSANKLRRIDDPMGRRTIVYVNSAGNLQYIRDAANGLPIQAVYDSNRRITTITDRRAGVWNYAYDPFGALRQVKMPTVGVYENGVDLNVRPEINQTSLENAVLPAAGTGTTASPAARVYPDSVRLSVTDARGNTSYQAINRLGLPTWMANASGDVSTFEYNPEGQIVRAVDAHSVETRYSYSGGLVVKVVDVTRGDSTRYSHGAYGQVFRIYRDDAVFEYQIDNSGNVESAGILNGPSTISMSYDARGRLTSHTDPEGHNTTYYYALSGLENTDSIINDGTKTTRFTYDSSGRPVATTDPLGGTTQVAYDAVNRDSLVTDPLNATTSYEYDAAYVETVTDALGQTHKLVRNALGWPVAEVNAAGDTAQYSYDRSGNLTRYVNRRGQTVTWSYDAEGRVTSRSADGATTTYAYAPDRSWVASANSTAVDTTWIDKWGLPERVWTELGGTRYDQSLQYDAHGKITSISVMSDRSWNPSLCAASLGSVVRQENCQNAWLYTYAYQATGALEQASIEGLSLDPADIYDPAKAVQFYNYTTHLRRNADAQAERMRLSATDSTFFSFPSNHRLGNMSFSRASLDQVFGTAWGYDVTDRIESRRRLANDSLWTYTYDSAGRLTHHSWEEVEPQIATCEWDPDRGFTCLSPLQHNLTYGEGDFAYDAVGNPTDSGAVVSPGNRLTQYRGYTLQYDADGNLVSKSGNGESKQYDWNSLNQLIRVVDYGEQVIVEYGYDAWGRLTHVSGGAQQRDSYYLWAVGQVVAEVGSDGAATRSYLNLPDLDNPHSFFADGERYTYVVEPPGHVTGVIDESGTILNRYGYGPFGEPTGIQEQISNDRRYASGRWDADAGLYNFGNRWYDPTLRRFASEDPIGLAGGLNLYSYAYNDPVNLHDPTGLTPEDPFCVEYTRNRDGNGKYHCVAAGYSTAGFDPWDALAVANGLDRQAWDRELQRIDGILDSMQRGWRRGFHVAKVAGRSMLPGGDCAGEAVGVALSAAGVAGGVYKAARAAQRTAGVMRRAGGVMYRAGNQLTRAGRPASGFAVRQEALLVLRDARAMQSGWRRFVPRDAATAVAELVPGLGQAIAGYKLGKCLWNQEY